MFVELQYLFDFIDAAGLVKPGTYRMVSPVMYNRYSPALFYCMLVYNFYTASFISGVNVVGKQVRPYPRRAFSLEDGTLTFEELSLTNKQEALFLELL